MKNNPQYLGVKLKNIRISLGYTLEEMGKAVGKESASLRSRIFEWEKGLRNPDLISLLKYARLANVYVDDLIDDDCQKYMLQNKE
jgi:transcriptional regulator with XRE-family HTH domain